jgi:hypothetical protein
VEDCELLDLGAGGVKIGETSASHDEDVVASNNVVSDCLIAHGGRIHPEGVGIWVGQSHNNTIEHNDIHDFYYTGISMGWTWGYGASLAHDNIVAYNKIYQLGQGVLSDMGAIYTLGISPGTVLHHNLMHDVWSFDYGGWGIYPDEGTSDLLAENNIVYGCKSAGFHHNYGQNNMIRNNIFALNHDAQLARTRIEDHLSFTMDHNIVYWKTGSLFSGDWSKGTALDYQDYWDASGQPVKFGNMSLEQWQATGRDQHSIIADPLFVAPDKADFRLKPDSPALKLGFKPIDMTGVGPRGHTHDRDARQAAPRAFPPPPGPQPIVEDFETTAVGEKTPGAVTNEENDTATIRVTDEMACTGKHSLKFIDAAGQQHSWNPHFYYQTAFDSGQMKESFDVRMEPGAIFFHEWRDSANPYHVGPSFLISGDGHVSASGKPLMQIPLHTWVTFQATCGLGKQAIGKYSVTIQVPGEPKRRFELTCDPAFKTLRWYGFGANADGPGVFYLDDIRLAPVAR